MTFVTFELLHDGDMKYCLINAKIIYFYTHKFL